MKKVIVEIELDDDEHILSVKADGKEIKQEVDSIGRNEGYFYNILGESNVVEVVEWII